MKNKFKSYSFWMSVTAAVILVINNFGTLFGFEIDSNVITKIVDSICGVLILFGVITMTKKDTEESAGINDMQSEDNDNDKNILVDNNLANSNSENVEELKKSIKIGKKTLTSKESLEKFSMNQTSINTDKNEKL
jgi:uncharacterized membrane protein